VQISDLFRATRRVGVHNAYTVCAAASLTPGSRQRALGLGVAEPVEGPSRNVMTASGRVRGGWVGAIIRDLARVLRGTHEVVFRRWGE